MNSLDAPYLAEESPLRTILRSAILKRKMTQRTGARGRAYWTAAHFGLDKADLFRGLSRDARTDLLAGAAQDAVEEIQYIEKWGTSFTLRMAQRAETYDEQMLYSLMSADEASHYWAIRSFLDRDPQPYEDNPFLSLLAEVVHSADHFTMLFVIQVVIEGWGVTHYRNLVETCQDGELRPLLQQMLADEARHYGSGLTLLKTLRPTGAQKEAVREVLGQLLQIVRCGSTSLVGEVARVRNDLTRAQKIRFLEQIDSQAQAQARLDLIRGLVDLPCSQEIVSELDRLGRFRAASPYEAI